MKKIVDLMTDIHVAMCVVAIIVVLYAIITPLPKPEIKLGPPDKIYTEPGVWI